jgi:hypothetical protein
MKELKDTFDIIFMISKVSFSFVRLKPKYQKISLPKFPRGCYLPPGQQYLEINFLDARR